MHVSGSRVLTFFVADALCTMSDMMPGASLNLLRREVP